MNHFKRFFWLTIFSFSFITNIGSEVYLIAERKIRYLAKIDQMGMQIPDQFIISPNIYTINECSYDCNEGGVYRYFNVIKDYGQRIVYDGSITKFLHSLTWVQCHGYKDDKIDFENALLYATSRRLHMTCGSFSLFANACCEAVGIKSRFCVLLTMEPWNCYNNGHSCIEVFIDGRWQAWDVDFRNYFFRDGNILSAIEFIEAVKDDQYEIFKFSESPTIASGDVVLGEYDYQFWSEGQFLNEENLRKFYKRSAQILLIREGENYFFTGKKEDKDRVLFYFKDAIYMELSDFKTKFYN